MSKLESLGGLKALRKSIPEGHVFHAKNPCAWCSYEALIERVEELEHWQERSDAAMKEAASGSEIMRTVYERKLQSYRELAEMVPSITNDGDIPHFHVAGEDDHAETCRRCGHNLRLPIHLRVDETLPERLRKFETKARELREMDKGAR